MKALLFSILTVLVFSAGPAPKIKMNQLAVIYQPSVVDVLDPSRPRLT